MYIFKFNMKNTRVTCNWDKLIIFIPWSTLIQHQFRILTANLRQNDREIYMTENKDYFLPIQATFDEKNFGICFS